MDPNRLFLARCEQLEELLNSHDELSAIDLSRILRQLLADQHSLVHTVNTNKMPIRFLINKLPEMAQGLPPPTFRLMEDGLDPDTSPPIYPPPIELTLDEFLKNVVLIANGHQHTVKDIIRFGSNVAGGVHHDPKPRAEYTAIKEFAELFGIGGMPAGLRQLRAISRVTLKALKPLRDDVKKQLSHNGNDPETERPTGPVAPQTPVVSNYGLVLTVYILYLGGFLTGITVLVGLIIAYLQRDRTDRVSQSHFQFQITTFWIGLLYFFVGLVTLHFAVGVLILLWWVVWTVIRCVKGLLALNMGEPIRYPNSWWFGE